MCGVSAMKQQMLFSSLSSLHVVREVRVSSEDLSHATTVHEFNRNKKRGAGKWSNEKRKNTYGTSLDV